MASGLRILIILIIGGIGVQTVYAKKDKDTTAVAVVVKKEPKKTAAKDTTVTVVKMKAVKKNEPKEETEVKIDGILEAGFDNNYKANKKTTEYKRLGRAEVDISFRPVKKVRADIGFEYNSKDSLPTIDKLYGQYNIANFSAVRFGYMKKSFGLEEKTGLDERYFHKRTIINDSLEYFGFLDHDLTLQYRHELDKKLELRGGFSWTKDSTRYLQNYSVEYDDKKNNLLLAAIIGHYLQPGKDSRNTFFVSSLSYKRTVKLVASEAELTYGSNPAIKSYYNRDAAIFGARLKENFFINTGISTLQQLIPVAEAAIYSGELDSNYFDTQFRAGLTLGFAKKSAFQWRNNYGIVSKINDGKRELWRKRFDSEIMVVF
jgi:hypothetical protein